jgi:hypothetical protein
MHIDRAAHGTARLRETAYTHRIGWLPDIVLQRQVVGFLDSELLAVSRIAELTGGRLYELLDEYRDSLIHEAVTGKLDVTKVSAQQMNERVQAAAQDRLDEVAV